MGPIWHVGKDNGTLFGSITRTIIPAMCFLWRPEGVGVAHCLGLRVCSTSAQPCLASSRSIASCSITAMHASYALGMTGGRQITWRPRCSHESFFSDLEYRDDGAR
jgi:hypothetical protein